MIELYAGNTPNGHRAAIFLEEMALPYDLTVVDVFKGGASTPEMLALNRLGRVPVLVDRTEVGGAPRIVSQSWAIGVYLAEKTGTFIPRDAAGRMTVLEWMFYLGTDVMMVHSTLNAVSRFVPEKTPSTIAFYEGRLAPAFGKLDEHLAAHTWLCDEVSIADLALYPVYNFRREFLAARPEFPHLARWGAAMDERPGCRRGVAVIAERAARPK